MDTTVRRLTRSTSDRIFAGVCGGLAHYLGIDPALTRILYVAVTLITGVAPGFIAYLVAWIIVPGGNGPIKAPAATGGRRVMGFMLLAVGLLGIGIAALINNEGDNSIAYLGPIAVIILAVVLLARKTDAAANLNTYAEEGADMNDGVRTKRLMRSSSDKKIAGVCGGFGNYFNVDPTLVRVLWILAILLGGTGILLYLILWVVMPLDVDPDTLSSRGT